ncbi:asparagine synthase (glutamine-hydrolyzing) [Teredinibacter waterburyi]|uniref:asparagine synthase (glutamine-hydrolyzing) n=1 Tax=Teredinibacter waterburyi TaxID=1500538 RepID=UPI00165F5133|nr:asparagine synthase (glutamine-hydrolyzing) [Teredinibacter waterburyi]
MCGIAGILQPGGSVSGQYSTERIAAELTKMSSEIRHRGPDDFGQWVSQDARLGLAHRRLSIVDLSPQGHQPMHSRCGRYSLSFNGEIYNYVEIRSELKAQGVSFSSESDSEVLLEAYKFYGDACLLKFDGMFAFAIYDNYTHELFIARDAFGEKPLYYTWLNGNFCFSSELKSLAVLDGFRRESSAGIVSRFLMFQYCVDDETIYRDAKKLRPGHWLKINANGETTIHRYFEFLPGRGEQHRPVEDVVDELETLLATNIKRRLRADVDVGAFLSGGIDSSLVVALATKKLNHKLQAFTLGFENWQESEHEDARVIAKYLGVTHHCDMISADLYSRYKDIGKLVDEPNADTSLLPTLLLSELARTKVKVVLSGDGADELFGGYGRYFTALAAAECDLGSLGNRYYSNQILPFTETEIARILPASDASTHAYIRELRETMNSSGLSAIDRMRKTDIENYLPGAVLAKVDRMSMRHGLEVRTPFLSIEMARFAESLPAEMLANGESGKFLLKRLALRYLPEHIVNKPKRGFGIPGRQWGEQQLLGFSAREFGCDLSGNTAAEQQGNDAAEIVNDKFGAPDQALKYSADARQWWLDHEKFNSWLTAAKDNNNLEPYKLWSLLHLNSYFLENNVAPPQLESIVLWKKLVNCQHPENAHVLVLTLAEVAADVRQQYPTITFVCPWQSGVYCRDLDWRVDLISVVKHELAKSTFVLRSLALLGASLSGLPYQQLRELKLTKLYVHKDNLLWKDIFPSSVQRIGSSSEYAPLLYDSSNDIVKSCTGKNALRDLTFTLSSVLPFKLAPPVEDPFLLERGGRFSKQTPARALSLLTEAKQWLNNRALYGRFYRNLKHFISQEYIRENTTESVMFILPSLFHGGAERQACNLMVAMKRQGYDVKLAVIYPLVGAARHYLPMLEAEGIALLSVGDYQGEAALDENKLFSDAAACAQVLNLRSQNIALVQRDIVPVYNLIAHHNPGSVVCFLDISNCLGGVAALLAGVPKVLTSFRNIQPTSFSFYEPWYFPIYQSLLTAGRQRMIMTGNSNRGNKSYAKWLGVSDSRFRLLKNGVQFERFKAPSITEIISLRQQWSISESTKVIVGVFRLSEEKRPFLFVDAVAEVVRSIPDLRVLIVSDGPLFDVVADYCVQLGLGSVISLVGAVENVASFISCSDVVLQTSRAEGTSNVVLEAQYLAKPVVVTAAGGQQETLMDGETGYIVDDDSATAIANKVVDLLQDKNRAQAMGDRGRDFVKNNFDLMQSVETLTGFLS